MGNKSITKRVNEYLGTNYKGLITKKTMGRHLRAPKTIRIIYS